MSRSASFTQSQVRRAVKAAQSAGLSVKRLTVNKDGSITIESGDKAEGPVDAKAANRPTWAERIRRLP